LNGTSEVRDEMAQLRRLRALARIGLFTLPQNLAVPLNIPEITEA